MKGNLRKLVSVSAAVMLVVAGLPLDALWIQAAQAQDGPDPMISVRTDLNHVVGFGWPEGVQVTLTVDDPATPDDPDYTDTQPGDEPGEDIIYDIGPGTYFMVMQFDADGDNTQNDWRAPNPRFRADTYNNNIMGQDWTEGTTVTLTIDDPATGPGVDYTDSMVVPPGAPFFAGANIYFDMVSFQLQPGQFVTISDGVITKELIVTTLTVGVVDPDADTISGTADPGAEVEVRAHGESVYAERRPIADAAGNWTADFSQPGDEPWEQEVLDIAPSKVFFWVGRIDEDGDSTGIPWNYDPHFEVRRTFQAVWGKGWLEEATVTLTIDDDDDPGNGVLYTASQTAGPDPWGDPHPTWAEFQLQGIIEIQTGYVVRMNDGVSYKEHIVKNPMVTSIDLDADTVFGLADPYASLVVEIWEEPRAERRVEADESGHWIADFSDPAGGDTHDINPETTGAVFQTDDDNDSTVVDWSWSIPIHCVPGDTVTGTVYEADGVTPVEGAMIHFEDFHTGVDLYMTEADVNGHFGCSLPEGDYRIWAIGGDYSREYYEETILENATLIEVITGTELSGVDFTLDTPLVTYEHITFNMTDPVLSDLAVRQAIAYGTDREQIISATFPSSPIMDSYLAPIHWAYTGSGLPQYDFNPQLARDILDTAGWVDGDGDGVREKDGLRLHIDYYTNAGNPIRETIYQIFVANMADIGIEVQVFALGWQDLLDTVFNRHEFDIYQLGWRYDINDDTGADDPWAVFVSGAWLNAGLYSNPTADQLVESAATVSTRAEKLPFLVDHQILVMSDLATLPLVQRITAPPPQPDLWAVEYRWGEPAPGYSFAGWPIFEGWMNVRVENRGDGDAFNVTAEVMSWPANTTVPDPNVTIGNIPTGGSAWSGDTFTTRVDMMNPVDPCEGVFWRIEYDDVVGVHHVVENVPEFPPGEGPCD